MKPRNLLALVAVAAALALPRTWAGEPPQPAAAAKDGAKAPLRRVTGIGGIFFKAKDPKALREWYRVHLGLDVEAWGGVVFRWADDPAREKGRTVWTPFKATTTYFEPSQAPFMIDFRVADLRGLLAALRAEGCDVQDKVQESEAGKFGYVLDPEGNRIELWEPPEGK